MANKLFILLTLATACSTYVDVDYRPVCTESDLPALKDCVDTSTEDQRTAERLCRVRICLQQEAWLRHREQGGPGAVMNSYEVPCARVTSDEDREACNIAGYRE